MFQLVFEVNEFRLKVQKILKIKSLEPSKYSQVRDITHAPGELGVPLIHIGVEKVNNEKKRRFRQSYPADSIIV